MKAASKNRVAQIRPDYVQSQEMYVKVKKKRHRALIRRLTAFAIVFAIIAGGLVSTILSQQGHINKKEAEKAHLEKKFHASKDKEKKLNHSIKLLHNKDYIGEIARRDFLLSKDGEIIFSAPDADKH